MDGNRGSKKPVLACDVDEVLAWFMPQLVTFHNREYGTDLSPESFHSFHFHEVWGGSKEECSVKMDAFFESEDFNENIESMTHAREVLDKLSNHFELHVVTARQHKVEETTRRWLDKHFPNVFVEVHFGNHYCTTGVSRSKAEMCQDIGAVLLIDDSFTYASQCASVGIPAILFGDYRWNRDGDVSSVNVEREMICRVEGWHQVYETTLRLTGLSKSCKKPVLACDVDDVLSLTIPQLAIFHNREYGTDLSPESFHSYQFHTVWGGSLEESYAKLDAFFASDDFNENIESTTHARAVLDKLSDHFELHVVTARQQGIEEATHRWLDKHFPNVFTEVHFGNHYCATGTPRSKAEMCQDIGAVLLIDDSFTYASQCANVGIPAILFGDYRWNRDGDVSVANVEREMICRVEGWHQVYETTLKLTGVGVNDTVIS